MISPRARRTFFAAIAAAFAASPAQGVEWTGGGVNDNWTNANNWWNLNRPDAGDTVYFTGTPSRTSPYVNDDYTIHNLYFDNLDTFGTRSSFTINGNSTLKVSGSVVNFTDKNQTVNVHLQFIANGRLSNNPNNTSHNWMSINTVDTNGRNVTIQPSDNGMSLVGAITGSGRIIVDGPGYATFSASNSWTGGLEMQRGTVNYDSGPNLGSLSNWLDFNASGGHTPTLRRYGNGTTSGNMNFFAGEGRIAIASGVTVTHSGAMVGSGSFAKHESGTLILTGTSLHTGRTYVREGPLRISGDTLLSDNALEVSTGATLQYDDNKDDRVASISGGGTISLGINGRFIIGGTAVSDGASNFAGSFTGPAVEIFKYGAGTIQLTAGSTQGGRFDVAQGTLLVNNTASNTSATGTAYVSVYNGSVVGGDGRIAGTLDMEPGSTLVPSNAATPGANLGSISVGTLLHRPDSTIAMELSVGGGGDTIHVSGNAFLDGDLALSTVLGLPLNPGAPREIIHVDGTITDTFRTITGMQMSNGKLLAVTYGAHGVFVTPAQAGDASLDGKVNFDDLLTLSQNYSPTTIGKHWALGDFDGNGATTFDDLLTLAQNYGYGTTLTAAQLETLGSSFAADWALAQSMVPEPASAAALMLAGATLVRRRR